MWVFWWKTYKSLNSSKCYNSDEDDIKTYEDIDNNSQIYCINLFKKGNDSYLIISSNEKVIFLNLIQQIIKQIQLGEQSVNSLCSINEKNIIASNSLKLKIIDMETYSVVKKYFGFYDKEKGAINEIEKIKMPEKGEFLITYLYYRIKIMKI